MNGNLLQSVESWLARPAVESVGWTLVHFLWQGAAVTLLLAVVLVILRGASAGLRYAIACGGLLVMALCPLATFAWIELAAPQQIVAARQVAEQLVRLSNVPTAPAAQGVSAPGVEVASIETAPTTAAAAISPTPAASPRLVQSLLPWFVAAWLIGVAALSARLCAGWIWIQRLRRRHVQPATPEWEETLRRIGGQLRVTCAVRLLESTLVRVPTVIGWLRPVILVPASVFAGLAPRHLEALLAHELAHIRRHDYLVNLFQTSLETLLFYHPGVWWVSNVVRAEREACCDEIAARACGDRLEYARALASMEECRTPQLALSASGGPLLDRIRRIVGVPAPRSNRAAWWVMAAAGVLAMLAMPGSHAVRAVGQDDKPPADAASDEWGPESNGVRCRLVALLPTADEEMPDLTTAAKPFAKTNDVTFGVELKNVGEKPVTLLGVRYSDSYPTAAGKLATESFAPHLFEFEFTDLAGKPLARPSRVYLESMLHLSGASAHELAPDESLAIVLRPAKFNSPMDYELPPGEFQARVRYRGPSEKTAAELRKHWPDKPQGKAWTGEATSNRVTFTVAGDAKADEKSKLAWGEPKEGLRVAAELRRPGVGESDDPPGVFPLNSKVDVVFHLENVSTEPIAFVSETWRQDDHVTAKNEAGEERELSGAWYSGWPVMIRWTLRPGDVAKIQAANLALAADDAALEKFEHPVGKSLVGQPAKYALRYTVRLGSIQSKDDQGNAVFPAKSDWQGELVTGDTPLTVRARTPEDDERERMGNFIGRVEFFGKDGTPIEAGTFTVRTAGLQGKPPEMPIHAGASEIPDCSTRALTFTVRAPGFEEAVIYDVQLKPNETKRIELTPAASARFRLLADGKPVAGALVRFFNKTSDLAGGGPYPVDGVQGAVWATSQADGTVLLDSLQKSDPFYAKLGDAVYFFYVEAPGFAGRFVGGVKAGTDLGDIPIGPPLEVRGEITGTPEELERFDADWDQPFELKTATPSATFVYAVSQRLETKREGDKLTFHLVGLRQGKLRLICNFSSQPSPASHTYGRRDPSPTDVVVEVDLKETLADLVITPKGRQ